MSQVSHIEWTDASWNPATGCTQLSPGCDNCYAKTFAERFRGVLGHPYEQGFDLKLWQERIDLPLRWKKPSKIFVNSMSDLFHEDIPRGVAAFVQRSQTTPSPSPSRALGTISFGNPLPPPALPWTLDSPASTASSHDSYMEVFTIWFRLRH